MGKVINKCLGVIDNILTTLIAGLDLWQLVITSEAVKHTSYEVWDGHGIKG